MLARLLGASDSGKLRADRPPLYGLAASNPYCGPVRGPASLLLVSLTAKQERKGTPPVLLSVSAAEVHGKHSPSRKTLFLLRTGNETQLIAISRRKSDGDRAEARSRFSL
uniref:Uncharacterized protein n=1 Tax=Thermogemmatispora argillosa TaxID=2045280 RepID=A0A455SWD6_9CHLR|nr:hypothetical protein KTA_09420 [Thermogemmatispora argillosa]